MMDAETLSNLPYRSGVGIALFNRGGKVLCAERCDQRGSWQMPQGGVKLGEDPLKAVKRELLEEVGTDKAEFLMESSKLHRYEFPDYVRIDKSHIKYQGKYRGQEQRWYAMLFTGVDDDINLDNGYNDEPPEFIDWRWVDIAETVELIVPFKRPVYEALAAEFGVLADKLRRGLI